MIYKIYTSDTDDNGDVENIQENVTNDIVKFVNEYFNLVSNQVNTEEQALKFLSDEIILVEIEE
jgi:hypothetical protein